MAAAAAAAAAAAVARVIVYIINISLVPQTVTLSGHDLQVQQHNVPDPSSITQSLSNYSPSPGALKTPGVV
jgi:hypothetical protein